MTLTTTSRSGANVDDVAAAQARHLVCHRWLVGDGERARVGARPHVLSSGLSGLAHGRPRLRVPNWLPHGLG
jgi:hypothetical protein